MTTAVLGAGNWGTTIALLLHGAGHDVRLWECNEPLARDMRESRENVTYLPGYRLPDDLHVVWRLDEALDGAGIAAVVVPSSAVGPTAEAMRRSGALHDDTLVVSLTKGLEHGTLRTMTDVLAGQLGERPFVALSGPCIAAEVARGLPTTIVSASTDGRAARMAQDVFMTPRFRVYTSDDPLGVQLGGALKNIIAIAAGINDGLGFGSNAKSALVTRGIVEMTRLGVRLGARAETFNGLSGIGDLITTCVSGHSRNRHVGEQLGRGRKLDGILGDMVMVAEGVPTTEAVHMHARREGLDMPITESVYRVLFEDLPASGAVDGLMTREAKPETREHR